MESLRNVAEKLRTEGCAEKDGEGKCKKYVRPVLMTHYPLYRTSDGHCVEPDAAPKEERNVPFKEKWDCISKESTELLLDELKPRQVTSLANKTAKTEILFGRIVVSCTNLA